MRRSDGSRSQIVRNGVALFLAYALPRFITLGGVVIAARWMGSEAFGAYGTAAAFAVIAAVMATFGMLPLLVREIARAPERAGSLLRAAHLLKAGTCGLMIAASVTVSFALFPDAPEVRRAAWVLSLGWALNAYAENLAAYYQAVERMGRWTQASTIFGVVSSVTGVALLLASGSIVMYCWGFVAGWAAALVWLALGMPEATRAAPLPGRAELQRLGRDLVPFGLTFVGLTVYSKVDMILLQRWGSMVQAGYYSAAYKFVDVFQALLIVAAGAVYPRLSRTADGADTGRWGGGRSTDVVVLAATPVGLGLFLVAEPVVRALYGEAYGAAAGALEALSLMLPLLSVSIVGGYVLGAAGRIGPVVLLYAGAVAVNVALDWALIPGMGARGAALARLVSQSVLAAGFVVTLARAARAAPSRRVAGVVTLVVVAAAVARALPDVTGGWLRLAVLVATTGTMYLGSGVVDAGAFRRVIRSLGSRGHPQPGAEVP